MFHLLQNSECRIPFEKCQARRKSALKISPEGDFSCLEGLDQTAVGDIFPAAAAVRFVVLVPAVWSIKPTAYNRLLPSFPGSLPPI